MTYTLSPDGWYYKFDPNGPTGQRLTRKRYMEQSWAVTTDSVQLMTGDELRFVAAVIDDARVGGGAMIKPCPFCGSHGDTFFKASPNSITGFWWTVECNDRCLASGPMETTEEKAIASWNRRVDPLARLR